MINPYYVLRDEMLSILLEHSVYILNQWSASSSQQLEATLFCLKSISEEIPTDEDRYIAQLFGPQILGRLPTDCSIRLKNTILLLMGKLSSDSLNIIFAPTNG